MHNFQAKLLSGSFVGVKKGWTSFVWMCKIIIPVSFLVTLLHWTSWLNQLDFLLNPLMRLIDLPPEAALPIITGMLIDIYAVIAIISVLPFTIEQMTLIAIFSMTAHNLIMEGIVQRKSGTNAFKVTLVRISAAIVTVLVVSQFFGGTSQSVVSVDLTVRTPFVQVLKDWTLDTTSLLLKIMGIIMGIMIVLETLKSLGWLGNLMKFFRPLMKVLGLSDRTAMMWMAANLFGLFYGGAVIVEEARRGNLTKEELEHLHVSIGINHAMVEDPALYALLGLNPLWLLVPRLIMAVMAVHTYRVVKRLKSKLLNY